MLLADEVVPRRKRKEESLGLKNKGFIYINSNECFYEF